MDVFEDPTPPLQPAIDAVKKVFKCSASPAVIAAAAIARAAGVTMLEGAATTTTTTANTPAVVVGVGAMVGDEDEEKEKEGSPSTSCPAKVMLVGEKENIDPNTGIHARLASGAAAAPRTGCAADGGGEAEKSESRIAKGGDDQDAAGSCVKPERPPLADITAAFVSKGQLKAGMKVVIGSGARGVIDSVSAADTRTGGVKTSMTGGATTTTTIGVKRAAEGEREGKHLRVLRFLIR